MRFLVTGGAGFIGSNIAEELLKRGEEVRVIDNLFMGKRENLSFAPPGSIDFHEADIRSMNHCRKAVEGVDYVLHHAALASVPRSVEDPLLNHDINVTGTLNLLIAAREAGVRRFILASSSSVYGDGKSAGNGFQDPSSPRLEAMAPDPLSPYALSKLMGEGNCRIFHQLYGMETIALRYFNVYGRRQDPRSEYAAVIPKFIESVLNGERPVIYGDGLQSRDFIFVGDVVEANLKACAASQEAVGKSFNIACGRCTNLLEILYSLSRITGRSVEPVFMPAKAGDIKHSLADISRAEKFLGFEPRISFQDGLEKAVEWYSEQISKRSVGMTGNGMKDSAVLRPNA